MDNTRDSLKKEIAEMLASQKECNGKYGIHSELPQEDKLCLCKAFLRALDHDYEIIITKNIKELVEQWDSAEPLFSQELMFSCEEDISNIYNDASSSLIDGDCFDEYQAADMALFYSPFDCL